MHIEITVKVGMNRDQSCNAYTYTETTPVRIADISQQRVKDLIARARVNFEATLPHNVNKPTLPPIDVKVREVQ